MNEAMSRELFSDIRSVHRCIWNIMKWSVDVFEKPNSFPRGLRNIYQLVSSPSPVCSYIEPTEEVFSLLMKTLSSNIKSDSNVMRLLQTKLPFFHDLLSSLSVEDRIPEEWKGLILHLIDKAREPFESSESVRTPSLDGIFNPHEICRYVIFL